MTGSLLSAVWTPAPRGCGMKINRAGKKPTPGSNAHLLNRPWLKRQAAVKEAA